MQPYLQANISGAMLKTGTGYASVEIVLKSSGF
jgi:hypothetical protein